MIDDFFFIANKNNELHKIYFKAKLVNIEYVDYTETITNLYKGLLGSVFSEPTSKIIDDIKKMYTFKTNDIKIFFKHQLELVDYDKSNFTKEQFDSIFNSSSIFFLNSNYNSIEPTNFDIFRYIRIPSRFITDLDISIEKCNTILKYIEVNYKINVDSDFELLREKNRLLSTQDIYNMDKLIKIVKKREKVSNMIFDIDIDISNILINLYDLKFNKLNSISIVDANKKLSNNITEIELLEKELNSYKK